MSFAAVWAALRVVSDTVGMVPWRVMKRDGESRRLLDTHPVDRLIHLEPNEELSAHAFIGAMQGNALLWGNAYAEIVRTAGGRVVELGNPIHPSLVEAKRDDSGRLVYEVRPDHSGASGGDSRVSRVSVRDMLHLRGFSTNGIVGHAVLSLLKNPIGHGLALDNHGATYFGNGARPSGFLKHPGRLSPEASKNLVGYFHDMHGGPGKANKTGLLQEGVDWVPVSIAPEESQFLQSREFSISEIARIFGVPPHMLADLSRATFNNIEHMSIEFARHAIQPWAVRWEQEANRKLFDPQREAGLFTRMNLTSLQRADTKTRGEYYKTLNRIGVLSINEIRALEDMNPIGDQGDTRFVEMAMVPLEQAGDLVAARAGGRPASEPEAIAAPPKPDVELQKKGCARVFAATAAQLIKVESDRVSRAVKAKPDTFASWADDFYAKQVNHWRDAFRAPVEALADLVATGCGASPAESIEAMAYAADSYVESHLDSVHGSLLEAHADGSTDDLLKLWAIARPGQIAQELTDKIADAILLKAKAGHEHPATTLN